MGELFLIVGLLMIGLAIFLMAYSILWVDEAEFALQWAAADAPQKSSSKLIELSRPLVHRFCLRFAAKVQNPTYRSTVEKKIATAGLQGELNVDEFIGLQILWGLLFPLLLILLNFTLELGYSNVIVVLLGTLGFAIPHFHVNKAKNDRMVSVLIDLPFFIDLLALSTEAGLDFIGAIERVVEKADQKSVLAEEFGNVLRDLKLGSSRAEALKKMANRLEIREMTSFVIVLVDSDATGGSIGKVLKQQSAQMRLERFARAEKAGARASQLILVPLLIFILPAVFIMVFGPVVLQFLGQGG